MSSQSLPRIKQRPFQERSAPISGYQGGRRAFGRRRSYLQEEDPERSQASQDTDPSQHLETLGLVRRERWLQHLDSLGIRTRR